MHEFHLMRQVVKIVHGVVHDAAARRAALVRVAVGSLSHLSEDAPALQTAFALASQGTVAQGATLEIIRVAVTAQCTACEKRFEIDLSCLASACGHCGAPTLSMDDVFELRLEHVVVQGDERMPGDAGLEVVPVIAQALGNAHLIDVPPISRRLHPR